MILMAAPLRAQTQEPVQVRTEIIYRDGTVTLLSEFQERFTKTAFRIKGNVQITYQDVVITCDEAEYDEVTQEGVARGNLRYSQGRQWLTGSRAEFSFAAQTGTFYDVTGFTDQEYLVRGKVVVKTGRDTFLVQDGVITSCREPNPKWAFTISKARLRLNGTSRLTHTFFKVKGVPVLYAPYMILPMEAKRRSSGLTPPHYGDSTSKGRNFSLGYFQTLGNSADATAYADYFSLRGLAFGGVFRARPSPSSKIYIEAYGIDDKLKQGGAQFIVDAEASPGKGFRALAGANITTNFRFRQAFSDSFRSATTSEERSQFFLTQNQGAFSTNISYQREEFLFPVRSTIIRRAPSFEFLSLGQPIRNTPLIFYLRAAAEGVARFDAALETPKLVQRLDFHPRLAVRLPALWGFSLIPSAGIRETYYSSRISAGTQSEILPRSLHRQYFDFELDLNMPVIEKDYRNTWLGNFRHAVEPFAVYRRIQGIDSMREIIRFDEHDTIANTSELEFGIVNRIFARSGPSSSSANRELLSIGLVQKYYFDPTFGGALLPGQANVFYPLYTTTGFALTGSERRLPPTNLIIRITPASGISYDIRADYDSRHHRLRDASISANWQQDKLTAAGTYFKTNALEPGTFKSHHIQGMLGYGLINRGLSASIALSYDIRTANALNSNLRLNYVWDCCGVSLQFQQFDLGLRTESRLTFSFSLKGIGNFGTIRQPESLF